MRKRYVSLWFPYLQTDWLIGQSPDLGRRPLVLTIADHGRLIVKALNSLAGAGGIYEGMALADARAILPSLEARDQTSGLADKLLRKIGRWCIRFTPSVAVDPPDGLIFDATGCAHLWGGEGRYLEYISTRFSKRGYHLRLSMADTVGAAWAMARYGIDKGIAEPGRCTVALQSLPPAALRLEADTLTLLDKLGLHTISQLMSMPRSALRRRFGQSCVLRIQQALGGQEELLEYITTPEPYSVHLPCPEPITTATAITIALQRLLDEICERLSLEEKGLRRAVFRAYTFDGKIEEIIVSTGRATTSTQHLFKLFELRIDTLDPGSGIELFMLGAQLVETKVPAQEKIFGEMRGLHSPDLSELLDRISNKIGHDAIFRYLPAEHYWPERSFRKAAFLHEKTDAEWKVSRPRPVQLLPVPQLIEVTAPIPDYPPMLFRHRGQLHKVSRADGPERIEQEWWLQEGEHRDYYAVEDGEGRRYWIFRLGHYGAAEKVQWFLHGYFA